MAELPRLVALCGYPKSGKDEIANLLVSEYSYIKIDDGFALRDFAMRHLGLSYDDVYTQEGKARFSEVNGIKIQNRDVLGSLGNHLEQLFGDDILPWAATRNLDPDKRYVFPSCRKRQGWFYRDQDGVVIEVVRPGYGWSGFDFDVYDKDAVNERVVNDGSLEVLHNKVFDLFGARMPRRDVA